jgi:hypothetical protein
MRAIVHTSYGPPDELQLREVEKPLHCFSDRYLEAHNAGLVGAGLTR